ncbi:uncharacterized protein LOC143424450 [Xylocopa sonorina]|uniref:uncharacterized protein LOC143424450 n=1 Tax=Xylocopa sonorina TaxID=1818115 RepID=UPI00403AE2ED
MDLQKFLYQKCALEDSRSLRRIVKVLIIKRTFSITCPRCLYIIQVIENFETIPGNTNSDFSIAGYEYSACRSFVCLSSFSLIEREQERTVRSMIMQFFRKFRD